MVSVSLGIEKRAARRNSFFSDHVPFWELVYHGYLLYTPFRNIMNATANPDPRFQLKLAEYDGRPTFYVHSRFQTKPNANMGARDLRADTEEEFAFSVDCIRRGAEEYARRCDLHLILYDTNNDTDVEKWCVQNLIDSMVMGLVVTPVSEDVSGIVEMARGRVPLVFLGGKVTDAAVNCVCSDSTAGTEMALRHLIAGGHRRIAMVCDHKKSSSRSSKLAVYRRMMGEIGEPERVFYSSEADGDIMQAGYCQGRRLLGSGENVTAVFVVKDVMALGVIQALTEAGVKVPEQISVIGYDGIDAAALPMVHLTTVAQPRMEMAEKIIDILRRHAEDPDAAPEHYQAMPELVVRGSSARL